jgi:hypothetical protein
MTNRAAMAGHPTIRDTVLKCFAPPPINRQGETDGNIMNIASVSTGSTAAFASGGSSTLTQLEKKLVDLEKQLAEENQNTTEDADTKKEKIKLLELEIQMIEMQIQQEQAKAAAKKSGASETKSSDDTATAPAGASTGLFNALA